MATDLTLCCSICETPVPLEDCKIDEQGRAVHESCYCAKVGYQNAPPPIES